MTTEPNTQGSFNLDRELLEMLMYKISVVKKHGQAWFARKMNADKKLYDEARKDMNGFLKPLQKRGYDGERFGLTKSEQKKLF